jgi:hypothetical protein
MPFHYGYWDDNDGHHRAANELTLSVWDPVSKQPNFKCAAVQLCKLDAVSLTARAADMTAKAVDRAREVVEKVSASMHTARSHVPDYLGRLSAAHKQFVIACEEVTAHHVDDLEIQHALQTLSKFSREAIAALAGREQKPNKEPQKLRKAVISKSHVGPLALLADLHGLLVLVADMQASRTAVAKAVAQLRDRELLEACALIEEHDRRQHAWLMTQLEHRAAHTLVVPS